MPKSGCFFQMKSGWNLPMKGVMAPPATVTLRFGFKAPPSQVRFARAWYEFVFGIDDGDFPGRDPFDFFENPTRLQ